MTTALAFDLFLDEYDVLEDVKLFTHIKNELKSKVKTTRLSVVKNDNLKIENPKNEFPEIKSLFFKNENPENEISKNEFPFIENGISFVNENSKNEILDSEKIRKDMMKGYMELLSN